MKMFKGEDSIVFETKLPFEKVSGEVEEALRELGRVEVTKKGSITIEPKSKYKSLFADSAIEGLFQRNKKTPSQYTLIVSYDVSPTVTCWIVASVVTLVACIGFLLFLAPYKMKRQIGKDVLKALAGAEDAVTGGPVA